MRLTADRQAGHNRSGRSERRSCPELPICGCRRIRGLELEAVGQEVLGASERMEVLAAGVWQVLIQSAGGLSEGQQVALAVAEERAPLAVSLAGMADEDGHDVAAGP